MRLLNCYVENFGGLCGCRLDFDEGLTVIEEGNGFGKTTLAEFIKAMYYGLPSKGRGLDKNIRRKYSPWQGGKYGGYLEFEHEGTRYRISRYFGASRRFDSFDLYEGENLKRSSEFTENIGEELFRLDADSFERSTYMPQLHDFDSMTTAGIQAKLGNLVEDTNDINNFDKALEALKKKRSALIPFRGRGGSVGEATGRISALQSELDALDSVPGRLTKERRENGLLRQDELAKREKLDKIRREIISASEAQARVAIRDRYRDICRRADEAGAELDGYDSAFRDGVPSEQDVQRYERKNYEYNECVSGLRREKPGISIPLILIPGILAAAGGAALIAVNRFIPGGILIGAGAFLILGGLCFGFARRRRRKQQEDRAQRLRAEVDSFLKRYYPDPGEGDRDKRFSDLRERMLAKDRYEEAKARFDSLTRERDIYFAKNRERIEGRASEGRGNIEDLKREERALRNEIEAIARKIIAGEGEIRSLQRQADEIPQKRDELEYVINQKREDTRRAGLLDRTIEFLEQAKESLNNRYLAPIKESFARYMSLLTGENGEDIFLGTDLDVRFQRGGEARELAYFSAGQTDLVMLCMRLALVDALFEGSGPFIILDDPFANLDDEHTREALNLLQALAKEHQIIYLVCNSSRSI